MLINSKELLLHAKKHRYGIPAPNFIDLDSARVFVRLAESLQMPLILPFAQAHENLIPLEEAALAGKYLAEQATVPVALHLDHGQDLAFIERAIDLGFTSVMIDASTASFEENIALTSQVVALAHPRQVTVEAELGHVGSGENYENHEETDSIYTEVKDVIEFVERTDIDSLAISIGTAHGAYKGVPKLNFERLEEIDAMTEIPLVLHGGSSSGDDNLARCAGSGIAKINIFTDLLFGAYDQIKAEGPADYLKLKEAADEGMRQVLARYYQVFKTQKIGGN